MMSMLVRRLGRLHSAYPMLMRLDYDKNNYPHRLLDALLKRKYCISNVAKFNPEKALNFVVPTCVTSKEDVNPEAIPENTYAHDFFLSSIKYANTVMQTPTTYAYVSNETALQLLEQDWNLMTNTEVVSAIKKLSYNIRHSKEKIEQSKYRMAFEALDTQKLTDDELMTIMKYLISFSNHMEKYSFYNNLCIRIDRECMMRFLRLPTDKILYLCDIIYQMTPKIFRQYYSQYIWYSIRNLGNKPQKLNAYQLVQILFFLNIYRKPPINMYELEYRLEQVADELSINELAIAALGFFKTSTKIRNIEFLKYIIRRTINEINMVHTVSIAAIVKLVRYSMTLSEINQLILLLKVLTPYEPRYTLMSLAHIAQTCGRSAIYNEKLMDRIIRRLNKQAKTARLKDFERFLYTFSILNIESSNSVYQSVIEELRATWDNSRAAEIAKFPHVASRIIGYMSIQNVYPIDLIKRVMAPEFVNKTCRGNYHYLSREYCVLDYSLRVELPEYNGPFLKSDLSNYLEKEFYKLAEKTSPETTRGNILFADVVQTCQELFNTTSDISVIRALPHYAVQDIILCLDEQNKLVPSEQFFSKYNSSDIKYPNNECSNNVRWIALIMGHPGLLIRNYNRPVGLLVAKMRQLSVIGYTPIMISCIVWDTLKSQREKRDYIKELTFRDGVSVTM